MSSGALPLNTRCAQPLGRISVIQSVFPRAEQSDKSKEPVTDVNVREGTVLRLKMLGANATPKIEGEDELTGKVNYFVGNDQAKWRRNIPTYRKVHFKNAYPGIDVVYYGKQRDLEYAPARCIMRGTMFRAEVQPMPTNPPDRVPRIGLWKVVISSKARIGIKIDLNGIETCWANDDT